MEFTTFVRKPFMVEAVEVTEENIADIAKFVGDLRKNDDGTHYISVNRLLFPNLFKVSPGFWMTRMGDNVRCYSKTVFRKQFIQTTPEIDKWFNGLGDHVVEEN